MKNAIAAVIVAGLLAMPAAVLADDHGEAGTQAPASAPAMSTETTSIGELIANAAAKAILDAHLPGLSDNPQIAMASGMTLRQIAGFSGGQISDEALNAIDADLARLPAQ